MEVVHYQVFEFHRRDRESPMAHAKDFLLIVIVMVCLSCVLLLMIGVCCKLLLRTTTVERGSSLSSSVASMPGDETQSFDHYQVNSNHEMETQI